MYITKVLLPFLCDLVKNIFGCSMKFNKKLYFVFLKSFTALDPPAWLMSTHKKEAKSGSTHGGYCRQYFETPMPCDRCCL